MSKPLRILRNVGIGLAGLIVVLLITTILVVQTQWFRDFVRQKIITATEEGTGGKVEIGSFSFDWRKLEVLVSDFVIHGREPAGAAPFVRVSRVQVNIRLFTSLRRLLDISFLGVERPEANILVFADGTTNIPEPKDKKPKTDKTILDTVVDLAVDYFHISNGMVSFNSQKQAIDVRGRNLEAKLWYNLLTQSYKGQISMQPLYVVSGRNTPVVFTVNLPVILERKRISFDDAKIATALSNLTINGSIEDLNNPTTNLRVNGHLAVADLKNLGNVPLDLNAKNVPSVINVDGNAVVADNRINVNGLRVGFGNSTIEASGTLKDPQGNGALEFKTHLALDELGRLAKVTARPTGVVVANGTAKLDANNNYEVTGNIEGRDLSFMQGDQRIRNVNLNSAIHLDPHNLDLKGLKLSAFGGQFRGDASLQDFARYKLNGNLRNLDLQAASRALGQKPLPYDGVVSGPVQAQGDLKAPGTSGVTARANLTIAPGRRGIPVSGRLNAEYNGATNNINVANSYIQLPHTRLNLSGSLSNRLNIDLSTSDLNDFLAAATPGSAPKIVLLGGQAQFTGTVTGGIAAPRITGHLGLGSFSVEGRRFDSLTADVAAAKNGASVSNGLLQRGPMQAQFAASAGLRNWSATPQQPLTATVNVRNGDLADVMALAGQPPAGYSGALTADVNIGGTIGNPSGTANLQVVNGTLKDEPFDRVAARVNLSDQLVTIPAASLTAGPAQLNLTAEFQHPRDSFTTGRLHAHVQSNQIDLARVRTLQKQRPNTGGIVNVNADVTGNLNKTVVQGKEQTEFLLASVNGQASARNLRFDGQTYGDFNAKATTSGQTVNYDVTSDFAGSAIKVAGNTQLTPGYPTTADANIQNLPVERLLAVARRTDIPARGNLSGTAHVTGTMQNPQGNVDLDLANAVVYDEPIDHVRARVAYLPQRIDVSSFDVVSGPARIQMTARFDHPANNLKAGDLQFRVNSSGVDLARVRNVQKVRPGLAGALQIAANGAAAVREGTPQVLLRDLNADVNAKGIAVHGTNFGDLTLKASSNARRVNFALDSNLAGASIQGRGDTQLAADYPTDAQLTFNNVTWNKLSPLFGKTTGQPPAFDALTEGQVTINGPVLKTDQLRGTVRLARLQLNTIPRPSSNDKPVVIHNEGPVSIALDRGVVRIESAHLVGPQTDVNAKGTASILQNGRLDLNISANTDLGILENVSRDFYSSGKILLGGTVTGTMQKPQISGKLELQNASVNYVDFPNGISNANGVVVFNGTTATIRNMTGESGGGKVSLAGFVALENGNLRLGVRANANGVRVRTQQGVSIVASARINLTGTTQSSLASGNVNIERITYAPQSDFGSILTRSAPPVQTPEAPNPLLQNMRLDIRVRTSASTAVQASLAQNIQVDADIRVRGTAGRPGVQGRVTITEGDLVFFGSKYRVSSGTISFYNPMRIEPVLNITLETQAKGVNVVLTVTGPVDNMKLSYTSDPPLQFQEIVALLASGRTPTSDPTLLANQPAQPAQTFQQMGESAIVSKAVADPIASRLQRVFGVSQLKIDPTFTSGSDLPQARVTLQQQVATNITFTYVTALQDPNTQIIRIEWSFNPQWSAVANRDENGIFSINFLYKKQFR